MINFFKRKQSESLQPCGIAKTVYPDQQISFNDLQLYIKNQLMVEIPRHRKPSKFHLNRIRL